MTSGRYPKKIINFPFNQGQFVRWDTSQANVGAPNVKVDAVVIKTLLNTALIKFTTKSGLTQERLVSYSQLSERAPEQSE